MSNNNEELGDFKIDYKARCEHLESEVSAVRKVISRYDSRREKPDCSLADEVEYCINAGVPRLGKEE